MILCQLQWITMSRLKESRSIDENSILNIFICSLSFFKDEKHQKDQKIDAIDWFDLKRFPKNPSKSNANSVNIF